MEKKKVVLLVVIVTIVLSLAAVAIFKSGALKGLPQQPPKDSPELKQQFIQMCIDSKKFSSQKTQMQATIVYDFLNGTNFTSSKLAEYKTTYGVKTMDDISNAFGYFYENFLPEYYSHIQKTLGKGDVPAVSYSNSQIWSDIIAQQQNQFRKYVFQTYPMLKQYFPKQQ